MVGIIVIFSDEYVLLHSSPETEFSSVSRIENIHIYIGTVDDEGNDLPKYIWFLLNTLGFSLSTRVNSFHANFSDFN